MFPGIGFQIATESPRIAALRDNQQFTKLRYALNLQPYQNTDWAGAQQVSFLT